MGNQVSPNPSGPKKPTNKKLATENNGGDGGGSSGAEGGSGERGLAGVSGNDMVSPNFHWDFHRMDNEFVFNSFYSFSIFLQL